MEQQNSIHWLSEVQLSVGFTCFSSKCKKNAVFMVHSGPGIPLYLCHLHGTDYAQENQLDPGPRPNWIGIHLL
jgi:hypothetical protein